MNTTGGSGSGSDYPPVQGQVTDREGKGTLFVTILDGLPVAG
jgi:hypothetical protein